MDAASPSGSNKTAMPFQFHGSGKEYFKIWIVNIFLTILTLGIYSAWAKVRKNKYFYGNTRLGDASFDYLADPMSILRGRLIAFGLFAVYSVITNLVPLATLPFIVLFLVAMPWIAVKSLTFRARNTAFRNIRFNFTGGYGEAAKWYIGGPLLVPITIGLAYPVVMKGQKQFAVANTTYGTAPFQFNARTRDFYAVFGVVVLVIVAMVAVQIATQKTVPWLGGVIIIPAYLFIFAFWNSQMGNIVYNASSLDTHRFVSDLRTRDILILYLTNTLGILLTLGLFVPWANVRLARYRAQRLKLIASGDLDNFINSQAGNVSSTGEEVGEIFDIDIGI